MTPPGRMVLLGLCALVTGIDLTCGYALRKPEGTCPPVIPNVRCINGHDQCSSRSDCNWNEMCCFNGCFKMCMKVSGGAPAPAYPPLFGHLPYPIKPDIPPRLKPKPKPKPFWPNFPPVNPDDPFPIYPPFPDPIPDWPPVNPDDPFPIYPPQPDPIPDRPLPPVAFPPMDPANYFPDENHLPFFPGAGEGGFNFP
ncbi:uncharacterized protein [Dendropsophus ebraccatus]|uniref:uncharacterized protein n=1 Tax=Dendropsophus ebraccatus TaxID=150705 RepID=UPI00383185CA